MTSNKRPFPSERPLNKTDFVHPLREENTDLEYTDGEMTDATIWGCMTPSFYENFAPYNQLWWNYQNKFKVVLKVMKFVSK